MRAGAERPAGAGYEQTFYTEAMAEQLFEVARRTFDTPHFRGIEFIEAEARSIINHVPGNYLPFNWTINPYRGCSHACTYCLAGDTTILTADGRYRALCELEVGDGIVGTTGDGEDRRYVRTEVLAHWRSVKPAYRVVLADGTEIVASGDHRLLTAEGWKHVCGEGRPHLVAGERLVGPGMSAVPSAIAGTGRATCAGDGTRVKAVEALGRPIEMFDITTGTGDFVANGVVSHNCFARVTHTYMDLDPGRDFERKIVVKVNAPELLRKELRSKRWKGEHIAMGTATDPYQRAEGRYKLMPRIIRTLTEFRNPFSILTKGTLILRDLELLREAAQVTDVSTALSIGTLDEEVWRRSEPGTPHPRKRMEAVARLNRAGVPCGVMVAPVLPGLSDSPEQLRAVVEAAVAAGATHVSPILLHLRPVVRDVFMGWLRATYPELVARYERDYAGSAYGPKAQRDALARTVTALVEDAGGIRGRAHPHRGLRRRPPARPMSEQLHLGV